MGNIFAKKGTSFSPKNKDGSKFTGTTYYLQFLSDQYFKWRNEQILLKTISFVDGVKNGVSRVIDLETGKIIKEKSFDDAWSEYTQLLILKSIYLVPLKREHTELKYRGFPYQRRKGSLIAFALRRIIMDNGYNTSFV